MRFFAAIALSCVASVHCDTDETALLQSKANSYLSKAEEDCKSGKCTPGTKRPEVMIPPKDSCAGFECKAGFKLKRKGKKECSGSKCRQGECCKKRKPKPPVTPKPCICPMIYKPVCAGTNTYSNECEAKCAGQSDFLVGACQKPTKVPTTTPEALTEPPTRPPPEVDPPAGCVQFGADVLEDCTNKAMFEWLNGHASYVAPTYNPSQYAEDTNWKTFEIQGTSSPWKGTCVAYVRTDGKSCSQWCATKELTCVMGMDDAHTQTGRLSAWLDTEGYPSTDCTTNPSDHGRQSTENGGCDQKWTTQMCACE